MPTDNGLQLAFHSCSPCGERRRTCTQAFCAHIISIHAPRAGSDRDAGRYSGQRYTFQSTLPARGATPSPARAPARRIDFNPRSPRGERHHLTLGNALARYISIHAPRAGSDLSLPARTPYPLCYFNPRSPCGERQRAIAYCDARYVDISIHAPRAGSDRLIDVTPTGDKLFQSTLPVRGATPHCPTCGIHAAHYFNPRSPCGERRSRATSESPHPGNFNPRSPYGERRADSGMDMPTGIISIHAPRTGSDYTHT